VHTIIYAEDPEATRAFFRDVLDLPYVDAHGGWLIFGLPPGELGIHPHDEPGDEPDKAMNSGRHELFLMCDDIEATIDQLKGKGVEFLTSVTAQGFGLITTLRIPGGGTMGLYQPRHPVAYNL
jgi:catechol 2,3-dioxygenase-like lactoylglutathione lyase family enzyme